MNFASKSKVKAEIPTASMADIAFLLIIFFLTTTVFSEDKGLQLVLPEASAEQVKISRKNIIHIFVYPDGHVSIKRGRDPHEQVIEKDELEGIMRTEIEANPNIIAAVKVDEMSRYRDMIDVLDELQLAEATRISIQPWIK
ncbi:MAG: ExbD/TolR family protein [Candidatus Glassbacteria bacterium]